MELLLVHGCRRFLWSITGNGMLGQRVQAFLVVKLGSVFAYTIYISCNRIQSTYLFKPCLNTLYILANFDFNQCESRSGIFWPLFVFGFPWLLVRLVIFLQDYWPFVPSILWIACSYPMSIFSAGSCLVLFDLWEPFIYSVY